MATTKEQLQMHLTLMTEIVLREIESYPEMWMPRTELVHLTGLKMLTYPHEAKTQAETTWVLNALLRMLQDQGRIKYVESDNRVYYRGVSSHEA